MKIPCTALALIICASFGFSQTYTGPIPKPSAGYGSDGSNAVSVITFSNPHYPAEDIRIYYPDGITSAVPTLFYSHGYGGNNPLNVNGLLHFFAGKGYAIVFVPYQTTGVTISDRYTNLLEGFRKAARDYPSVVDTGRVGFIGHSFGGGATISIAYNCFTENNWGQNGRFVSPTAQWYSFDITQAELQSFPANTKMLSFIFESDTVNDHRMAAEIFRNINIPASEKDFIKVAPSTVGGYNYLTGHDLPSTYAAFDALDYFAYYRLLDALCDYTFNGNLGAKDVALGNGNTDQVSMPSGLTALVQTDTPVVNFPESIFTNPCSYFANPRKAYCDLTAGMEEPLKDEVITVFPNPAYDRIHIAVKEAIAGVDILNIQGRLVQRGLSADVSLAGLEKGIYFLKITFRDGRTALVKVFKRG